MLKIEALPRFDADTFSFCTAYQQFLGYTADNAQDLIDDNIIAKQKAFLCEESNVSEEGMCRDNAVTS